jgi:hypothetical protein
MQKGTTSKGMEANKNFAKWLSCGIQISGTFGLLHVLHTVLVHVYLNIATTKIKTFTDMGLGTAR